MPAIPVNLKAQTARKRRVDVPKRFWLFSAMRGCELGVFTGPGVSARNKAAIHHRCLTLA